MIFIRCASNTGRGLLRNMNKCVASPPFTRTFCQTTILRSKLDTFNVSDFASNEIKLPRIEKCRPNGINIAGVNLKGGVILINGGIFLFDVSSLNQLTAESLQVFDLIKPIPDVVIVGTGSEMRMLPKEVVDVFKKNGIVYEVMKSKTACDTYNILVDEDRNVAAVLLPIIPTSAREPNFPEEVE
jgi:uncharacterized protein